MADASGVRRPSVSASPGQIEYFDKVCQVATEVCCEGDEAGECLLRQNAGDCTSLELWAVSDAPRIKFCDETSDCGAGGVCCSVSPHTPLEPLSLVCKKNRCVNPETETCLAGGGCSHGRACKLAAEREHEGYCE